MAGGCFNPKYQFKSFNYTYFHYRMRAILFDWLVEVCEVYKLHRETFYLAVDFIDRFLGSTTNMPKTRVQLIGESMTQNCAIKIWAGLF